MFTIDPYQRLSFWELLYNPITAKSPKNTLIKGTAGKEKAVASRGEESSSRRVRFDTEDIEMERESEDPEVVTDEEPKGPKVTRVPSYFIGKPLVDFDAGMGRVSEIFHWTTRKQSLEN